MPHEFLALKWKAQINGFVFPSSLAAVCLYKFLPCVLPSVFSAVDLWKWQLGDSRLEKSEPHAAAVRLCLSEAASRACWLEERGERREARPCGDGVESRWQLAVRRGGWSRSATGRREEGGENGWMGVKAEWELNLTILTLQPKLSLRDNIVMHI